MGGGETHAKWICSRKKGRLQVTVFSCLMSRCDGINRFYYCSRDPSFSCGLGVLTPKPSHHHFLLYSQPCRAVAPPASRQRVLPNTWRTTFINVTGLLPTVHFFLWLPPNPFQLFQQQRRVPCVTCATSAVHA